MNRPANVPASRIPGLIWPGIAASDATQCLAILFQFEQSQWWSREDIQKWQLRQLAQVVRHAARCVPFYESRLASLRDIGLDELTLEDIAGIPTTKRLDVQLAGESIFSSSCPAEHGRVYPVSSSGSTGRPISVRGTELTDLIFRTLGLRFHFWHCRDFSLSNLTIRTAHGATDGQQKSNWATYFPTGPSWRLDIAHPIPFLLDRLIDINPHYLQTHPFVLEELIHQSVQTGRRPENLLEVRSFGEMLEPAVRDLCRTEWGVPISNNYSSWETGIIALQCPESDFLHIQSENVLLEVLDDDNRPCDPGQPGRVVISVLNNFASPLIRYELGDIVELADTCPCGRGLPALRRVVGRIRNRIQLPNGNTVIPAVSSSDLVKVAPIRQFQLVQKTPTQFEILLVTPRPLTEIETTHLKQHFNARLHYDFDYCINYVDSIPRLPNGKYEIYRSELPATKGPDSA